MHKPIAYAKTRLTVRLAALVLLGQRLRADETVSATTFLLSYAAKRVADESTDGRRTA